MNLLLAGHEVVVLDDLSGGFADNVTSPQVQFIKGSVTNVALVDSLFDRHRFDYVFHLAAYAAEGRATSSGVSITQTICWGA